MSTNAQAPPRPTLGDRFRVTAPAQGLRGFVGTVRTFRGDTLTLDSISIPLASVTQFDRSVGRTSHWLAGTAIGFVLGGTIGAAIGANQEDCNGCTLPGAIMFGAGGAVVGLITGLAIRTERWQPVDIERLRVDVGAARRLELGVSLTF